MGMKVEAAKAIGFHLVSGFVDADDCVYLESPGAPALLVMVEGGLVVRVESSKATYATEAGVRVGDTLARARAAYSGLAAERGHQYVEDGQYLVAYARDRSRAVVIEVVEGKVVQIRGGLEPAVEYVEGCS